MIPKIKNRIDGQIDMYQKEVINAILRSTDNIQSIDIDLRKIAIFDDGDSHVKGRIKVGKELDNSIEYKFNAKVEKLKGGFLCSLVISMDGKRIIDIIELITQKDIKTKREKLIGVYISKYIGKFTKLGIGWKGDMHMDPLQRTEAEIEESVENEDVNENDE